MQTVHTVLCILGAMIGAGFASGQEMMRFFTGYGPFSWCLIVLAAIMMTGLMYRVMQRGNPAHLMPRGKFTWFGKGLLLLLLVFVAGGMEAAAGELFALTVNIHHARGIGLLITSSICVVLSQRNMRILSGFGLLLLPLLLIALALCRRLPDLHFKSELPDAIELFRAIVHGIGYAGMNVMLSAGVLCDAAGNCGNRRICRSSLWAGGALLCLLLLYNAALLPYRVLLREQPLPLVMLLRVYGKAGFYLSAAVLYLAVITTLMAVMRAAVPLRQEKMPTR